MAINQSIFPRPRFAYRVETLLQTIAHKLSGRPKGAIAAFGIFFAVAILVLFLADLRARYRAEVSLAEHSARDYAAILAEHTALTFEAVDRALRQAQLIHTDLDAALAMPGADEASLRRGANDALKRLQKTSLVLLTIVWTNENGDIEAFSHEDRPPLTNLAGRPYFIPDRDNRDDELHISAPFRAAASDRTLIAVSRRLAKPDGGFGGYVVALLEQSYFRGLYRSLDVGPRGAVSLLDRDGVVFIREPAIDASNPSARRWRNVTRLLRTRWAPTRRRASSINRPASSATSRSRYRPSSWWSATTAATACAHGTSTSPRSGPAPCSWS